MTAKSEYRPDIDGLRALAVLGVIFYHFEVPGFPGGFTGVDVFFVISGYLITRIILNEIAAGTFTLTNFWLRRIRRIVPALVVVLLTTAAGSYYFVLLPSDFSDFGWTLMLQSVFLSNMWFMAESEYFAAPAETMPLLHTWTLALEEQFYILFPLAAVFGLRYLQARYFKLLMAVVAAASFTYGLWLVYGEPAARFTVPHLPHLWGSATNAGAAFYFIVPRLWEFLVGGLVAAYALTIKRKARAEVVSFLGLGAIVGGFFFITDTAAFPGAAVLLPVLGTAAVIVANTTHATPTGRTLSYGPLVWTGLLSYSLYLWHWPVLVFAQYSFPVAQSLTITEKLALMAITFMLAYVTYRFVENPIRQKRFLVRPRQLFIIALLVLALIFAIGHTIVKQGGFPERLSAKALVVAQAMDDINPRREECFTRANIALNAEHEPCLLGMQDQNAIEFVLWGDSHANSAMPAFDEYGQMTGKTGIFFGVTGCPPIPSDPPVSDDPKCLAELRQAVEYIVTNKPAKVFIIAEWKDRYQFIDHDEGWFLHGLLTNTIALLPKETMVTIFHRLPSYIEYNIRDVFLAAALERQEVKLALPRETFVEAHQTFYENINHAVAQHENARTLDPVDTLCDEEWCYLGTEEGMYNSDSSHLSTYGAREIILPLLLQSQE